jgi:hypothetical protein
MTEQKLTYFPKDPKTAFATIGAMKMAATPYPPQGYFEK